MNVIMMTGQKNESHDAAEDILNGLKAIPGFVAGYIDKKEFRVVSFHTDSHPSIPLGKGQQRVHFSFAV